MRQPMEGLYCDAKERGKEGKRKLAVWREGIGTQVKAQSHVVGALKTNGDGKRE